MKDSFILYTEQREVFNSLTDEEAGKLIKEIFNYIETRQENLTGMLKIAFIPIRQNLDRNTEKWEEIKNKRSEAGKLGAEIKKQKQAKQANANFAKNKIANQAVNVNVNDNVNVNVNDNVVEEVKEESDSCVDGLQKIIDFYNSNIGLITPYALELFQDYLKTMSDEVIIYAMKKSVEANKRTIQYIKAILNSWEKQGIKTILQAEEETNKFKNRDNQQLSQVKETLEEKIAKLKKREESKQ